MRSAPKRGRRRQAEDRGPTGTPEARAPARAERARASPVLLHGVVAALTLVAIASPLRFAITHTLQELRGVGLRALLRLLFQVLIALTVLLFLIALLAFLLRRSQQLECLRELAESYGVPGDGLFAAWVQSRNYARAAQLDFMQRESVWYQRCTSELRERIERFEFEALVQQDLSDDRFTRGDQ